MESRGTSPKMLLQDSSPPAPRARFQPYETYNMQEIEDGADCHFKEHLATFGQMNPDGRSLFPAYLYSENHQAQGVEDGALSCRVGNGLTLSKFVPKQSITLCPRCVGMRRTSTVTLQQEHQEQTTQDQVNDTGGLSYVLRCLLSPPLLIIFFLVKLRHLNRVGFSKMLVQERESCCATNSATESPFVFGVEARFYFSSCLCLCAVVFPFYHLYHLLAIRSVLTGVWEPVLNKCKSRQMTTPNLARRHFPKK